MLPPGWIRQRDARGRRFYVNVHTNPPLSSWTRPTEYPSESHDSLTSYATGSTYLPPPGSPPSPGIEERPLPEIRTLQDPQTGEVEIKVKPVPKDAVAGVESGLHHLHVADQHGSRRHHHSHGHHHSHHRRHSSPERHGVKQALRDLRDEVFAPHHSHHTHSHHHAPRHHHRRHSSSDGDAFEAGVRAGIELLRHGHR